MSTLTLLLSTLLFWWCQLTLNSFMTLCLGISKSRPWICCSHQSFLSVPLLCRKQDFFRCGGIFGRAALLDLRHRGSMDENREKFNNFGSKWYNEQFLRNTSNGLLLNHCSGFWTSPDFSKSLNSISLSYSTIAVFDGSSN